MTRYQSEKVCAKLGYPTILHTYGIPLNCSCTINRGWKDPVGGVVSSVFDADILPAILERAVVLSFFKDILAKSFVVSYV